MEMVLIRRILYFGLVVCYAVVLGCGEAKPTEDSVDRAEESIQGLRIVSLSPAITRSLVHLGLGELVVGRSAFCESVDSAVPVVGDLLEINYEQLLKVQPTHVLVQPPAGGADEELLRLAEERGWEVGQWRLNSMDDIRLFLMQLPDLLYEVGGEEHRSLQRESVGIIDSFVMAMRPVAGRRLWSGRVLVVSGVDPVMAFGEGTYLNDLLVSLGARNCVLEQGWVTLSLEDVVRLGPEAIILVLPGAQEDVEVMRAVGPLGAMDIEAVREGRVGVLRHADGLMPCSTMGEVTRELRSILQGFGEGDGG